MFVPKPTQRVLAIRTLFTEEQNHPGTVELPGRVIPDPNASGYVQSSMGGRLMPPEGGFPRLGTKVEAGQVLGVVLPVIGAADLTSQQAQLREVEQEISLIETKLNRYRKLEGRCCGVIRRGRGTGTRRPQSTPRGAGHCHEPSRRSLLHRFQG